MNHRRADAPVAHCPQCGGVVNGAIRPGTCSENDHAAARRRQMEYCVHCGIQLIVVR
jgi:hypothetical protein